MDGMTKYCVASASQRATGPRTVAQQGQAVTPVAYVATMDEATLYGHPTVAGLIAWAVAVTVSLTVSTGTDDIGYGEKEGKST